MPDGWLIFVAIIGALLTVLNIVDKVIVLKKKASEPKTEIESRLKKVEDKILELKLLIDKHTEYFDNDKRRLDGIEKETKTVNTIVIKSLQALTEHALDGSNKEELIECSKEMKNYLINR